MPPTDPTLLINTLAPHDNMTITAAQIQARVDAWLAARSEWLATGPVRRPMLAAQWHAVTLAFGADSAAALGVLLGLVREAWGEPRAHTMATGGVRSGVALRWACWVGHADYGGAVEAEALLAALEAAP